MSAAGDLATGRLTTPPKSTKGLQRLAKSSRSTHSGSDGGVEAVVPTALPIQALGTGLYN